MSRLPYKAPETAHSYVNIIADDCDSDYLMIMVWGEPGDLVCTLNVDDRANRIIVKWPEEEPSSEYFSDFDRLLALLEQGAKTLRDTYAFLK